MTCKYIMTHCTKAGWRCYFKPITTFTRGSALIRKEEREEGILEATIAPMMMVMACSNPREFLSASEVDRMPLTQ